MYDVITVGSATIDVFLKTRFSELVKIIDPKGETDLLAYPSGSKILVDDIEYTIGGGGTNTAVALSRLGHKVGFLGKLGEGTNSSFIHENLKKEKIDLLCTHGKGHAGYSVILDTLEHDRTILVYKGINDELRYDEIPKNKLKTKWFYFGAMLGQSFHTLERLAEFADKNNIKIAFNPSTYLSEKGSRRLKRILSRTELLVLNKEEACLLVGQGTIEEALPKLIKLGPKNVVVTNGKNKVYAMDEHHVYTAKPNSIKVVETTGAGDAFAASLVCGFLRKNDLEMGIKLGVVNAQSVISHYGSKNRLLSFNEAKKEIKRFKVKVHKKKI